MDRLEKDAIGGEMMAQFFFATLFDPDLKLSTIVQPDAAKSMGWYARAANQGDQMSMSNLAISYSNGTYCAAGPHAGLLLRAQHRRERICGRTAGQGRLLRARPWRHARSIWCRRRTPTSSPPTRAITARPRHSAISTRTDLAAAARAAETALKYYRAAADKGDSLGLHNLGAAYNSGLLGLQRDPNEASRLIVRALETKYDVTVQSLTNASGSMDVRILAIPAAPARREGALFRPDRRARQSGDAGCGATARALKNCTGTDSPLPCSDSRFLGKLPAVFFTCNLFAQCRYRRSSRSLPSSSRLRRMDPLSSRRPPWRRARGRIRQRRPAAGRAHPERAARRRVSRGWTTFPDSSAEPARAKRNRILRRAPGGARSALPPTAPTPPSGRWPSQAQAEAAVAKKCAEYGRGACKVVSISGGTCVALSTFNGRHRRTRWNLSFTAGGNTYPEATQFSDGSLQFR